MAVTVGRCKETYVSVLGLWLGEIFPQSLCSVRGVRKVVGAVVRDTEEWVGQEERGREGEGSSP